MTQAFDIRPLGESDRIVWARLRHALWPEASEEEHIRDIARVLAGPDEWAFLATRDGEPVGFAEIAIRKYANGCESQPVPFLEGIWVEPHARRQGIGRRLIAHVEAFVRARGFRELGSDALIDNKGSHAAHAAWGFSETERVVYFRKSLGPG
jgi:aminoglycoside 6'-N-acetyltransferase I